MDVRFRFEYLGKSGFGEIWRPIALVTLQSPFINKSADIWMIIDTGADYTILPQYISEKLRISLRTDCIKDVTGGVGGEKTIYFFKSKVKAKIGRLKREIPLAFFDSDDIPPLLGRLGFLETFDTEFLKSHKVVFKD